jgi:hypothetical protein
MTEPARLAEVTPLASVASENVVKTLEGLLEKAKAGELRAVGVAFEYSDGTGGWSSAFGSWSNRMSMIGRLSVLAQHITLNEVLEWKPDQ